MWLRGVRPYYDGDHSFGDRSEVQVIGFGLYILDKISGRRENGAPSVYLAFSIGPEALAVRVDQLDVQTDEDALVKASPLFHDGLERIEVWRGSRKVGDIPPKADEKSNGEPIRDSA
jgi:hypothetical protein